MKRPNHYYRLTVKAPRAPRILVGLALVVAGVFGFLPVLGFWMIPLGLLVIFFELPWVRERWRQVRAWWKDWRGRVRHRSVRPQRGTEDTGRGL